ncbi:tRNA lysidine(34) synthetase TilS [Fluoribacter dumoffii]|uniref:tRNA lysidine(34) synthetase TilS n=1 Tax=Fluoribacter dumoffii TaxID=463 RepID=UPI00026C7646|nr:tRNA lysidine(34) synthetase TilS [Fluoribacter dumoffii]MCW8386093.1 tRNA lysidine(34) synthetase TilS [Fluoribacter dumoffii]MCW8495612.1 tRNA lysidine(34) synthetase TilS [Fluoribacter dumoffii]
MGNSWLWEQPIKPLLSTEWFSRLSHFSKLFVGFSGGLDSTVLLHVLACHPALFAKIVAVHVNHGISARASLWQQHCQQVCDLLNIPLIAHSVEFERSANIEEGARIARYDFFSSLMKEQDCLLLGHHMDDQAETVLLQLFRGAGVDGLAAMSELSAFGPGEIARPFLSHSREQLEHYAVQHQISWIEDESNQDVNYSRNYLRHQIIPLLKRKWTGVAGNIARTALHCQQAKRNLDVLAAQDALAPENPNSLTQNSLLITPLKELNRDRMANVLRMWLKNNRVQLPSTVTFERLIDEMIFARSDAIPQVSWGDVTVRRYQDHLYLVRKNKNKLPPSLEWGAFPSPLIIIDARIHLQAKKHNPGLLIPPGTKIYVRFRVGGEKIVWRGQTKQLKKLFQEWGIPPWIREQTPLIYFDDTLAAVAGYAMSDLFFSQEANDTWDFINFA